jgi:hypothetical protein
MAITEATRTDRADVFEASPAQDLRRAYEAWFAALYPDKDRDAYVNMAYGGISQHLADKDRDAYVNMAYGGISQHLADVLGPQGTAELIEDLRNRAADPAKGGTT